MARDGKDQAVDSKQTIGLAVSAAIAGTGTAVAQEEGGLEEIIVTATKREVSMQAAPISITAFSDEQITLQRFNNFNDYVAQIPGLSVSDRQPGAQSVIMRGCAAQGLSFSDSATTSVYLDEQPITAAGFNPDPRLIDVARIEALAGPQGTLFGDAAQCGTLRVITNKPNTEESSGWIDLTGSSMTDGGSGFDISAMVNVPIVQDRMALRLVGFYADEPGWVDNVLSPSPGQQTDNSSFVREDVNSSIWTGGRVGLRFTPNDQWTVDLMGIYQNYELDGFGDVDLNQRLYEDTSVFPTFGDRSQARFNVDDWEDEWYQYSLTIEGDTDIGNFVLSTAYFDRDSSYFADATAYLQIYQQTGDYMRLNVDPYITIYDFGGDPIATNFDERQMSNFSVEARYATPTEGRWSAIVGGFYNERKVDELFIGNVAGMTGTAAFSYLNYAGYYFYGVPLKSESNNWFSATYDSDLTQSAIFGEVSFDVTENFTITAGGRWFSIENDFVLTSGTLIGLNGGAPNCFNPDGVGTDYCFALGNLGESDEDGFVPKVNLSYQIDDDRMIYATYSEGFRRGGANSARPNSVFGPPNNMNPPPAGTLNEYDSDTISNIEFGAKTEWLDNRLRFNFAVYQMTWDDIQIQANDPQDDLFTLGIINFPEAEINGAEMWFSWLPTDNWNIEATLGLNDGEISVEGVIFEGTETELRVPKGTQLPIVPDIQASVNVTYSFANQMFGGEPYLLARFAHTGESVNSLAGLESSNFIVPVRNHDAWSTVDLQYGIESDSWSVSLFVDNVTDENAQLFFNNRWAQQRLVGESTSNLRRALPLQLPDVGSRCAAVNIDERIRDLGVVDSGALADAILSQDEAAWHEHEYRQKAFEVHRETESMVMVFMEESAWPDIVVKKEAAWERLASVAIPLMHDIIGRCYSPGGTIIRAMAAKLLAGGKITPHVDKHPSFHMGHRIHVPISTNRRVRFMIDGRPHQLEVGKAYEINNQKMHSVANKGSEDRITFIFDYVPPEALGRSGTTAA